MLLRATEESAERTMMVVGAVTVLLALVAGTLVVSNPFRGTPDDILSIEIETPYIGQGVAGGTAIVLHGVQVGTVTAISSVSGGGVRLRTELQKAPVAGLTDAMRIDYRPINYFGVTGINVVAGSGGQGLHDGMQFRTIPIGNSTLQALLSRLGEVATGALTPKLISTIDRVVRYTDALNPLVETVLVALDAVASVQTVPTARLLANATGIGVAIPPWLDSVIDAGRRVSDSGMNYQSEEYFQTRIKKSIDIGSSEIFGSVGRLLTRYTDDLLPAVDMVKLLMDPVPVLFRPADVSHTLVELRTRFEKMFAGTPEQRALQVRILLDGIPAVAAPLGVTGPSQ